MSTMTPRTVRLAVMGYEQTLFVGKFVSVQETNFHAAVFEGIRVAKPAGTTVKRDVVPDFFPHFWRSGKQQFA